MREHKPDLDRLGAVVLVVSFHPPAEVGRFAKAEALPFSMLSDPTRRAYAAFGLQLASPRQVWNWKALRAYVRGLLRGHGPRPPHGDLGQMGGDFVLDRTGAVVFAHHSEDPADRPPIERLLAAAQVAAGTQNGEKSG